MDIRKIAALPRSGILIRAKDWTIQERLEVAAELEQQAAELRKSAEIMELSALAQGQIQSPQSYLEPRKQ